MKKEKLKAKVVELKREINFLEEKIRILVKHPDSESAASIRKNWLIRDKVREEVEKAIWIGDTGRVGKGILSQKDGSITLQ